MTGSSRAVLVTGSNGFIGTHLIEALSRDNQLTPVAAVRSPEKTPLNAPGSRVLGNLEDYEQLDTATLQGIQVVVHAAARAHILSESRSSTNPFQKANVDATLALARTAAQAGVTRFIFISSIG
ncbi:NAD(P)-dependent oxidoreductase, partial [Haloferax sp. KTX1]|uniref:NAD-dependent epimerase/dehydratase family protein n=1 Tax=Haloferax sp. KTX1 TaxID=2600597 RepID=UPI0011DE3181